MVVSLLRAVLEDLAHGPGPVCSPVWGHDSGQHLPCGLCLQERQVCSQTQVRHTDAPAAVSSPSLVQREVSVGIHYTLLPNPRSIDNLFSYLCHVTGLLRNERMPFLRR